MNTAEKMTRLMIELIQSQRLNLKKDINSFIGEHIPPDLQGEERALARVNLGDALESWFEEKLPDNQKISTCFLKEVVDYIDWIAIAQAIDFGHWTNEITEDAEYEGFTNSLTFTVWHWITSGDETKEAYGFCSVLVDEGRSDAAKAKTLMHYFWEECAPSLKRNPVNATLVKAGITCVNWVEIIQALRKDFA